MIEAVIYYVLKIESHLFVRVWIYSLRIEGKKNLMKEVAETDETLWLFLLKTIWLQTASQLQAGIRSRLFIFQPFLTPVKMLTQSVVTQQLILLRARAPWVNVTQPDGPCNTNSHQELACAFPCLNPNKGCSRAEPVLSVGISDVEKEQLNRKWWEII